MNEPMNTVQPGMSVDMQFSAPQGYPGTLPMTTLPQPSTVLPGQSVSTYQSSMGSIYSGGTQTTLPGQAFHPSQIQQLYTAQTQFTPGIFPMQQQQPQSQQQPMPMMPMQSMQQPLSQQTMPAMSYPQLPPFPPSMMQQQPQMDLQQQQQAQQAQQQQTQQPQQPPMQFQQQQQQPPQSQTMIAGGQFGMASAPYAGMPSVYYAPQQQQPPQQSAMMMGMTGVGMGPMTTLAGGMQHMMLGAPHMPPYAQTMFPAVRVVYLIVTAFLLPLYTVSRKVICPRSRAPTDRHANWQTNNIDSATHTMRRPLPPRARPPPPPLQSPCVRMAPAVVHGMSTASTKHSIRMRRWRRGRSASLDPPVSRAGRIRRTSRSLITQAAPIPPWSCHHHRQSNISSRRRRCPHRRARRCRFANTATRSSVR